MRRIARLSALALLAASASVRANDYWVSAVIGSNASGSGTQASPWRTITYALSQGVTAGDVLHVLCGLYDAALGETFPISIPAGAALRGQEGAYVTILDAGTAADVIDLASDVTVSGFTIRNSAHGWWNAGVANWSPASNIVIDGCVFLGNERGLHLWNGHANVLVRNCVFADNANDAFSCFGSTGVTVLNCSFHVNLKGMIFDGSTATVRNTIVTYSSVAGIQNSAQNPSTLILDHNCLYANAVNYDPPTLPAGAGSISADPRWADSMPGDLHVWPTSPCIDGGTPDPLLAAVDVDGDPRVAGGAVDLGADERAWPDFLVPTLPLIGTTVPLDVFGNPGSPWLLFAAPLPSAGFTTPWGTLYLDLLTVFYVTGGTLDVLGGGLLSIPVPMDPSLVGGTAYLQMFGVGAAGFALSPMRLVPVH